MARDPKLGPIHPGEFLLEEFMKPLDLSQNALARALSVPPGRIGEIVNERSRNLEKFQGVEEATLDLYTAVRNAYLQSRTRAIRE